MENESSNEGADAFGPVGPELRPPKMAATRLESSQRNKTSANAGYQVMNITAGSTAYDDAQLARRLPPDLLLTVLAYEDELQRLQALPARKTKLMRQVKIDAALAKDADLQAAIAKVLEIKRKSIKGKKQKDRASFIQTQLESTPIEYGLPADYADTARQKDIRLIRKVLREWEKINGLSCKSEQPD
ncbi:hypothetical protein OO307_18715 [Pseudomonas sp. DCB_E]|nr:hypothetical protein [Pseudomonas sp. DCB_E]